MAMKHDTWGPPTGRFFLHRVKSSSMSTGDLNRKWNDGWVRLAGAVRFEFRKKKTRKGVAVRAGEGEGGERNEDTLCQPATLQSKTAP